MLICLGLVSVYGIYRLPVKYVTAMKYPAILLSFAATVCFFFYPHLAVRYSLQIVIMFLTFYGLTFYLITMDEKGNNFFKEVTALSVLFLASAFNLAMIGQATFMFSMTLAVTVFLFVAGRYRIIPFIAGYTLVITILVCQKGIPIVGSGMVLEEVDKYLLFSVTFILLLVSFIGTLKQVTLVKLLPFFGFLYLSIDVLMVVGFKFSGGLLHQPFLSVLIVSPFIGLMLKEEGRKA